MTEYIELGSDATNALRGAGYTDYISRVHDFGDGHHVCMGYKFYLSTDTLLTGRQVSAAVKADPERLGARHKVYGETEKRFTDVWTGVRWEYAGGQEADLPPDDFDREQPRWHLVYRPKIEPQPQVFHSLAEFVTWAEHPDRLGQVSGIDADGDKVMVERNDLGQVGLSAVGWDEFVALALPITAVVPTSKRQGKALRQWMVSHPGAKIRTECGRMPVWWDSDECDYFNEYGPAAVDDDVIGIPVSGNWND